MTISTIKTAHSNKIFLKEIISKNKFKPNAFTVNTNNTKPEIELARAKPITPRGYMSARERITFVISE